MGRIVFVSFMMVFAAASVTFAAPGPKVSAYGNKHNLRGNTANTVYYKATYDPANRHTDEICIFCHTPHNATPSTPLWGHKQSVVTSFGHYSSATLVIDNSGVKANSDYNEPNGSSRLCLGCHDGATALGAVLNGPEIPFNGGQTIARRNGEYNVFNPGTVTGIAGSGVGEQDATKHHHPISFKYTDAVKSAINTTKSTSYKYPWEPPTYIVPEVKLDRNGYMQCTTCHNPHQDMSGTGSSSPTDQHVDTPFWVIGTGLNGKNVLDTVCLSCHPVGELQIGDPLYPNDIKNPYPY